MVKLTPLIRPKDVPLRMRPLKLHIVSYGDVLSTSEFFSGTSLGRNFAEWVLAFSSFRSSNYHLFSRNDILKQSVSSTSEPNPVEDLRWSFCKSNEKPLTIFEKSFILDVRLWKISQNPQENAKTPTMEHFFNKISCRPRKFSHGCFSVGYWFWNSMVQVNKVIACCIAISSFFNWKYLAWHLKSVSSAQFGFQFCFLRKQRRI